MIRSIAKAAGFLVLLLLAAGAAAAPGSLRFTASGFSGTEGTGAVALSVSRTGGGDGAASVGYFTIDDWSVNANRAFDGGDYVLTQGTLHWADGEEGTKGFTVPLLDDAFEESDETFVVILANPVGATIGDPDEAVVTIVDDDSPPTPGTLSLDAWSYAVTEGEAEVTIGVTRVGGSSGAASIRYHTDQAAAEPDSDFQMVEGTLQWADGETTTRFFSVPIVDGCQAESREHFWVYLDNPVGALLGQPDQSSVTISDDDPDSGGRLRFSAADYSVAESAGAVTLAVQRVDGCVGAATIHYRTAEEGALYGADYGASGNGELSWMSGDDGERTITVTILDDGLFEGEERFWLYLSGADGATIGDPDFATVTILDDESAAAGTLQFSAAAFTAAEEAGTVTIGVTRLDGNDGAVSVDYTLTPGGATAGEDFLATSGTLRWDDGDGATRSFSVTLLDDDEVEDDEQFGVALLNAAGGAALGSPVRATVTITSDDAAVPGTLQFTAADYRVAEGAGNVVIGVSRREGDDGVAAVRYRVAADSARFGGDYGASGAGVLSWGDGDTATRYFSVEILDDGVVEGEERFLLYLEGASGATLGSPDFATVTIEDNDRAEAGTLQLATPLQRVAEGVGEVVVTVTREGGDSGSVTVGYTTIDGRAEAGEDFVATSGILRWADGDAAVRTFAVALLDDERTEEEERFVVALLDPAGGATLGEPDRAEVVVVDDDQPLPGQLRLSAEEYRAGEGEGELRFEVERVAGADGPATVHYQLAAGTASAGEDFVDGQGTLAWEDGEDGAREVRVTLLDDARVEGEERLTVWLSRPEGAALTTPYRATLFIDDDDLERPWEVAANLSGERMTIDFTPSNLHREETMELFLAGRLEGEWYLFTLADEGSEPLAHRLVDEGMLPFAREVIDGERSWSLTLGDGAGWAGMELFFGYGDDGGEMLAAGRYRSIHAFPAAAPRLTSDPLPAVLAAAETITVSGSVAGLSRFVDGYWLGCGVIRSDGFVHDLEPLPVAAAGSFRFEFAVPEGLPAETTFRLVVALRREGRAEALTEVGHNAGYLPLPVAASVTLGALPERIEPGGTLNLEATVLSRAARHWGFVVGATLIAPDGAVTELPYQVAALAAGQGARVRFAHPLPPASPPGRYRAVVAVWRDDRFVESSRLDEATATTALYTFVTEVWTDRERFTVEDEVVLHWRARIDLPADIYAGYVTADQRYVLLDADARAGEAVAPMFRGLVLQSEAQGELSLGRLAAGDYELVLGAAVPGTLDPYGIAYHPFSVDAVAGQRLPLPRVEGADSVGVRSFDLLGREYRAHYFRLADEPGAIPMVVRREGVAFLPIDDPEEWRAVTLYAALIHPDNSGITPLNPRLYGGDFWQARMEEDLRRMEANDAGRGRLATGLVYGGEVLLSGGLIGLLGEVSGVPTMAVQGAQRFSMLVYGADLLAEVTGQPDASDFDWWMRAAIESDPERLLEFIEPDDLWGYLERADGVRAQQLAQGAALIDGLRDYYGLILEYREVGRALAEEAARQRGTVYATGGAPLTVAGARSVVASHALFLAGSIAIDEAVRALEAQDLVGGFRLALLSNRAHYGLMAELAARLYSEWLSLETAADAATLEGHLLRSQKYLQHYYSLWQEALNNNAAYFEGMRQTRLGPYAIGADRVAALDQARAGVLAEIALIADGELLVNRVVERAGEAYFR